jgi:hypothetical protein
MVVPGAVVVILRVSNFVNVWTKVYVLVAMEFVVVAGQQTPKRGHRIASAQPGKTAVIDEPT